MSSNFSRTILKSRREFLNFSHLDVVKRLYEVGVNISDDTLRNWESGETVPDADKLPALAEVLKCKVHEFYNG